MWLRRLVFFSVVIFSQVAVVFAQPARIGIYFGSFDPVHNGHVAVVRHALEFGKLDRLVIVPSGPSSRRFDKTKWRLSVAARWDALRRRFLDDPRVEISTLKLRADASPYTASMIDLLRAKHSAIGMSDARFLIVAGDDFFATVPKYHRAQDLLDQNDWLVFARFGEISSFGMLVPSGFEAVDESSWKNAAGSVLRVTSVDATNKEDARTSSTEIDLNLGQAAFRVFVHGAEAVPSAILSRAGFERVSTADLARIRMEDPHGLLPHLHFSVETFKPWWDAGFRHHYLVAADPDAQLVLPTGLRPLSIAALEDIKSGMTHWQLLDLLAVAAGVASQCERAISSSD